MKLIPMPKTAAVLVIAVSFAVAILAGPPARGAKPPKGKLGDCDSPTTYPDLSSCVASASACQPVGTCYTMEEPIERPPGWFCPPTGCPVLRVETVVAAGFCDVNPEVYTLHCKKCAAFACASGHTYQTMEKCLAQVDPQCCGTRVDARRV